MIGPRFLRYNKQAPSFATVMLHNIHDSIKRATDVHSKWGNPPTDPYQWIPRRLIVCEN